ncbi:MAG: ATP-dependent DNA helicase [Pseudomonadales bacterium]
MSDGLKLVFSVGFVSGFSKVGDINARISHQTSAMEGIQTHRKIQHSRGSNYIAEKKLSFEFSYKAHRITIQGRADGYRPPTDSELPWIEEIKTTRLALEEIPEGIVRQHINQTTIYGHMLCQSEGYEDLNIQRTYVHPDTLEERIVKETLSAGSLQSAFEKLMDPLILWFEQRSRWFVRRNRALASLEFPFQHFRPGQRLLSESIYRNSVRKARLMLQAPTGLGKSIAGLYPALKALPANGCDKIFYLSAKTAGQASAETALEQIHDAGSALRSVVITAKAKTCFNPDLPCDPKYCEYARGYYDRLPKALSRIQDDSGHWGRKQIEALARSQSLCPFELSLDAAVEADVIVGDYNYLFSPSSRLKRFFDGGQTGPYSVLLDEVHNLVERGRSMFSAGLTQAQILNAMKGQKLERPQIVKALKQMNASILKLSREHGENQSEARLERAQLNSLLKRVQQFLALMEEVDFGHEAPKPLMDVFFDAHQFQQVAEKVNDDYCPTLSISKGLRSVQLNCIHPGPQLQAGYDCVQSLVGFSATLAPKAYFAEFLGLSEKVHWLRVPSPFPAQNQLTLITQFVSVNYEKRIHTASALVELVSLLTQSHPGNYLIYLPSFDYLDLIASQYQASDSEESVLRQTIDMSDIESREFTDSFTAGSRVTGFAVIGGKFAEGIDLKGLRLRGAVIVSLGLAPRTVRLDELNQRLKSRATSDDNPSATLPIDAYDYAYRFPALQRIIQTAGRVIRSEDDKGVVVLVDPRFCHARNLNLLPEHWRPQTVRNSQQFTQALNSFWQASAEDFRCLKPLKAP